MRKSVALALVVSAALVLGYVWFTNHQHPDAPYTPTHADHSDDPVIYAHDVKG